MPAKQIISILALSALILLPVGIAKADDDADVDIDNGRSRVTIQDGSVIINRPRQRTYVSPSSSSRYRYYRVRRPSYNNRIRDARWRHYNNYNKSTVSCNGVGRTYNRTINSRSSNSSTFSSIQTSSCQQ